MMMRILLLSLLCTVVACSSPQYNKQAYAPQKTSKVMEYDYDLVWKGVKEALADYRLKEVNSKEGRVITEWIYSSSNHKYIDIKVNGEPRRKYLQARYKYKITLKRQIVGVLVNVDIEEEVESLSADGLFKGWIEVDDENKDTSKAHEVLLLIERKILGGRHL